jgi:FSR family fosmidomycin resistance protein-like MFS transporter
MTAVILAGLGNALYHVGAGSVCLQLARGNAAMGGVYVGPGDLGVVLGYFVGLNQWGGITLITLACTSVALCAAIAAFNRRFDSPPNPPAPVRPFPLVPLIVPLLILAVAARQLVGGSLGGPWLSQPSAWIALACAAMAGKMLFGFAADRFGWMLVSVPLAVTAAILLPFSTARLPVALAATLLVQAAMPVTLAAMSRTLPTRPALAFGAASTAIWLGSIPAMIVTLPKEIVWSAQAAAAAAIATALLLLRRSARLSRL